MRLLDLFCGAGGAAMGYYQAGFTEIVGVDIAPQKRYPFEFVQGDALEFAAKHGHEFDLIHASPPCQKYSLQTKHLAKKSHPELIEPTQILLNQLGKPYIIENVPGAPLNNPITLCGSMFGLALIRHRLFECKPAIWFPPAPCSCHSFFTRKNGGYSAFKFGVTAISVAGNDYCVADGRIAMGIDWMTGKELSQAIPPAYTKWLGKEVLKQLERQVL